MGAQTPIVTFGATLARLMSHDDVRRYLAGLDANRAIGTVHIAVCRSHHPNEVNVEAWLDAVPPAAAIAALAVADQRLRRLHGIAEGKLNITAIDAFDAQTVRASAEQLVDAIRAREMTPRDLDVKPRFELSREKAVHEAIVALTMAPMMISALAKS